MKARAAALALLVAGCGGEAGHPAADAAGDADKLECAIGADAGWSNECRIERSGEALTIHHPDGGFRRFRVLADGRGVEAADGSELARLQIVDRGRIEIRIGGDRYRMPVTVAGLRER